MNHERRERARGCHPPTPVESTVDGVPCLTCKLMTQWSQSHPRAHSRTPGPRKPWRSLTFAALGYRDWGLVVTQRQVTDARREEQLRSLLAWLSPSLLLQGQMSRTLAGGVGTSSLPLLDWVTGILNETWRAFSLPLTSYLCDPSAMPSLLGSRVTKHPQTLREGVDSSFRSCPSWLKCRKQNKHFCAPVGFINWSK